MGKLSPSGFHSESWVNRARKFNVEQSNVLSWLMTFADYLPVAIHKADYCEYLIYEVFVSAAHKLAWQIKMRALLITDLGMK